MRGIRRPRRPRRQRVPTRLERRYQAWLRGYVARIREIVREQLIGELDPLLRLAGKRTDAWLDVGAWDERLEEIIASIESQIEAEFGTSSRAIVEQLANDVDEDNIRQIRKQLRGVLGVDIFLADVGLEALTRGWVRENVRLIKSIETESLREVEGIVARSVRAGIRANEIADQVEARFGVTRSRANLIGRDQISKWNGTLTQQRQEESGITSYIWRTSRDERVRPMHAALEGTEHKWTEPPVTNSKGDRNHPGGDYQCRCTAEPVIPGIENVKTSEADVLRRSQTGIKPARRGRRT